MTVKRQIKARQGSSINGSIRVMFGIPLFSSSSELLLRLWDKSRLRRPFWIATVNPEFVMNALKDRQFMEILKEKTTYNVIDGIGLVWAREIINKKNKFFWALKTGLEILGGAHREDLISGADLMSQLCQMAEKRGESVYFFGGWGDRAKKTADFFQKKYPKLKVAGYSDESFDFKTKTDYLFVARGMKKQEEWIGANLEKLNARLVMGVGRSFDYYSADLARAPGWIRRMGMEWLFSLVMEPKRWKRQLELPKFIGKVLFGDGS